MKSIVKRNLAACKKCIKHIPREYYYCALDEGECRASSYMSYSLPSRTCYTDKTGLFCGFCSACTAWKTAEEYHAKFAKETAENHSKMFYEEPNKLCPYILEHTVMGEEK